MVYRGDRTEIWTGPQTQIRKEAFVWHRLGVDTPEAADAHVRTLSALRDREKSILPRLGIAGRLPVEAERKYISSWVEMGFDDDAIALAYERTVLKKGSLVWPYMNSILKSWHQKGLHTLQQIKEGDSARKGSYPGGGAAAGTKKDEQSRIEEDLDWMDRYLEKTRGEAQ